eukprot:gnl/Chilomastix_cuspidata/5636.p1 GENE.gnl/Chilomastix_cuspidata/5636~~gnl/Chilomastix_cuspidata/5636.p1  ORF type:complete len:160 (+),score=66.51 gnl/Chilomastix_cuspidata/5636:66-545(+)
MLMLRKFLRSRGLVLLAAELLNEELYFRVGGDKGFHINGMAYVCYVSSLDGPALAVLHQASNSPDVFLPLRAIRSFRYQRQFDTATAGGEFLSLFLDVGPDALLLGFAAAPAGTSVKIWAGDTGVPMTLAALLGADVRRASDEGMLPDFVLDAMRGADE